MSCAIQPDDTLYQAIATPRSKRASAALDLRGDCLGARCAAAEGRKRSQMVRAAAARESSKNATNIRRKARKAGDIRPNYNSSTKLGFAYFGFYSGRGPEI